MNKVQIGILVCCVSFLNSLFVNAQNNKGEIKGDYYMFLNQFKDISFPFNYKKKTGMTSVTLDERLGVKYLKLKEEDFKYNWKVPSHESQKGKAEFKEVSIGHKCEFKYFTDDFIFISYKYYQGIERTDSCFIEVLIFDYVGNILDMLTVGEIHDFGTEFSNFVLLDEYHLKVFRYTLNFENYKKNGWVYSIIDNEAPKSLVYTIDYEILKNGKIRKIKEYEKKYLKNNLNFYKIMRTNNSDDPMNKY